jgi:hypothetical protein
MFSNVLTYFILDFILPLFQNNFLFHLIFSDHVISEIKNLNMDHLYVT